MENRGQVCVEINTLFALSNLWMVRGKLMQMQA